MKLFLTVLMLVLLPVVAFGQGTATVAAPFEYTSMGEMLTFVGATNVADTLWYCETLPTIAEGTDHAQWVPWPYVYGRQSDATMRRVKVPTAGLLIECTSHFSYGAVFHGGAIQATAHIDTVWGVDGPILAPEVPLDGDMTIITRNYPAYTYVTGAVDSLYLMGMATNDTVRVFSFYNTPNWMR